MTARTPVSGRRWDRIAFAGTLMIDCCRIAALTALLGLIFAVAPVAADEERWQSLMAAATTAQRAGNYEAAARHLEEAIDEARGFDKRDPRLASTLDLLAATIGFLGRAERRGKSAATGAGAAQGGARPQPSVDRDGAQ